MNVIDIIIIIALIVSVIFGLKDGVIRQIGTLVGIVVALFLAKSLGGQVGEILGIGGDYPQIWGFAIVLLISFIGVMLLAQILRKVVSAVGLGILDRLAGAALSLIKCTLILSVLLSLFDIVDNALELLDDDTKEESILYEPIISTSDYILPTINWVGEQIPSEF